MLRLARLFWTVEVAAPTQQIALEERGETLQSRLFRQVAPDPYNRSVPSQRSTRT